MPYEGSGLGEILKQSKRDSFPHLSRYPSLSERRRSSRVFSQDSLPRDLPGDSKETPERTEELLDEPTHARPDQRELFIERFLMPCPRHRQGIGAPGIAQVHHQWSIVILALTPDEEAAEVRAHLCVYRSTLGRSARLRGLLSKAEEPS